MPTYLAQTLSSTKEDLQGERMPLCVLQDFCRYADGRKVPLHQKHDMALPITGHMENLRVIPDPNDSNEWLLVGDVVLYEGTYDESWRGFSISTVVPIREAEGALVRLYLPFPQYNDVELIATLSEDPTLDLGKWIKKGLDTTSAWAIFGPVIAFVLKPVWDDLYKRTITPIIDKFLETHGNALSAKGVLLEHIQVVIFAEHAVEVRFKPDSALERFCFHESLLSKGLQLVASRLSGDARATTPGVQRIVLQYDAGERAYVHLRTEYKDGSVDVTP